MRDPWRPHPVAVSPIGVLVGIALIFFAPGYFLLQALFPGRRYFGVFHAFALPALSVSLSIAITVVVGSILGFLPGGPGGRGWFQGAADGGAPVLEITLGLLALGLFALGWWRGSFPLLGRAREYDNVAERGEPEEVTMLRDLRLEEERLRKEAIRVRKRAKDSRDPGVRGALSDAAQELERDRRDVALKAREVERKAGDRRYGTAAQNAQPRWRLSRR